MCPGGTTMKMRSARLDRVQEKMNESTGSIDWLWKYDDETDLPALKAVSMTSLSLSERTPVVIQEEEEPYRVRFSADIDCQPCIHLVDYTEEEALKCFYTKAERNVMTSSREDIIEKIDKGINDEDECEILRGLEYYCEETSKVIDERVDAVIDLVMDEQDDQIDENIFDEYTLSVAAQYVTMDSAEAARRMGAEDAKQAQEAYIEMVHNGSIGNYIMPSTLSTYEPTQDKKKAKRRRSSKRNSNVSDSPTSEKKGKKKKKEKKMKQDKKERRSSSVIYRNDRPTADEGSVKSEKSSKSSSSKKSKKNKGKKQPKKEKHDSTKTSADTVATAPETIGSSSELNQNSLSSDEDDRFLVATSQMQTKNATLVAPSRRCSLILPPIPDHESEDDDEPMMQRRSSWWDL
ncbi:unnamed protein product [Cylindrotheca closterium]|uniref:Uncharacterized protein n=1 Tax=Cylindrotheca closterium TaxID=2856 RepID=A0AAD2CHA0_9STRA|nr:unnamed protein product [Cylindrotheca closterium]